jgi:predicted MPP superfamily phosphohydrolase
LPDDQGAPRTRRLTRRRVLTLGASALGSLSGLGVYTWRIEPHWLDIVRRPLPVRGLPARFAGRTLAQISDVHVGRSVDDDYVINTFHRITALNPDIVVLTGDFISYHEDVVAQAADVYRFFPKGRMATLAILGNHDYGPAWSHPEIAQRVVDTVRPLGITVLRNAVHDVDGLQIAGLDDLWADRFDPVRGLSAIDPARPAVVLSHNPDTVDLPGWDSYEGWILAGHTHGGQCKPPFLPPPLLPVRNRRYTAGEFDLTGNRRLYVSRGVGHLLHVRFNVRPEVTVFELRSV